MSNTHEPSPDAAIVVPTGGRRPLGYDPDGLVDLALRDLKPATRKPYLRAYRAFARSLARAGSIEAASPDAALLWLVGRSPEEAGRVLVRFRADMVARGHTRARVAGDVTAVRRAVRVAKDAGRAAFDLDAQSTRKREAERARAWASLVVLDGPDGIPVVLGHPKPPLGKAQYRVIKALLDARPGGVSLAALQLVSGDARGILGRLQESDPGGWGIVIHLAGRRGQNYWIGRPGTPEIG